MVLLIIGYIIGVLNCVFFFKYNIIFGFKGILIGVLVFFVVFVLICFEIESIKRIRYLFYEFMFKVLCILGLMIMFVLFFVIVVGIMVYFFGWVMIFFFGQDSSFIVFLVILIILIVVFFLFFVKGRIVEFLVVFLVLVIVLIFVFVFLICNEVLLVIVLKQVKLYMDYVFLSMWLFDLFLNIQGLVIFFFGILLVFGLGVGVYYVIGSFFLEELNVERVLLGVFVFQLILGIVVLYIVVYFFGVFFQVFEDVVCNFNVFLEEVFRFYWEFQILKLYIGNLLVFVYELIQVFYLIFFIFFDVFLKVKLMVYFFLIFLYMVGFIMVIVFIEMGVQMMVEVVQINRRNVLVMVLVLSLVIFFVMWNEVLFKVFIFFLFSIVGILVVIEVYFFFKSF